MLHAPGRLHLGATDRLMMGDDRQRLDGGAGEPARLVPLAPEDMGHVRRRLEMPAFAPLDEVHPPPRIMVRQRLDRRRHVAALADIVSDFLFAHRLLGCDRKSTRLNSSHYCASRMTSSA